MNEEMNNRDEAEGDLFEEIMRQTLQAQELSSNWGNKTLDPEGDWTQWIIPEAHRSYMGEDRQDRADLQKQADFELRASVELHKTPRKQTGKQQAETVVRIRRGRVLRKD